MQDSSLKSFVQKNELYLSYVPPTYEYGTRPFLRWVLSQGRSPTREAVPKMPRTPSAFPFSGRRAINPTPPKRVKAWGDGPLRPEVMYPVVEHPRTDCAARNHSRSRVPHHRTQSSIVQKNELYLSYVPPTYEYGTRPFLRWVLSQCRSPTREAVPKMPRTPSAFPFSGRRAINPTRPKRVKAWGGRPPEARALKRACWYHERAVTHSPAAWIRNSLIKMSVAIKCFSNPS